MDDAEFVAAGRGKLLNHARPRWLMLGLEWDGPGVLLMASDKLSRAQLDFEARRYDYRDVADMMAHFNPSLALTTVIEDSTSGYVLIAAPDWMQAIELLFAQWTPGPEPDRKSVV